MRHPNLLTAENAVLLVVDLQESFRKHLPDIANLTRNVSILVEAAKIIKTPVIVTEQYPQGLGKTLAEITACMGDHQYFEKTAFSCCGATGFMDGLKELKRKQVIVCGIEAHVCVNQTVHDLIQEGYQVHVVADAIASRAPKNKEYGLSKMLSSGAIISCLETALFELLYESGTEQFKSVQRLIR